MRVKKTQETPSRPPTKKKFDTFIIVAILVILLAAVSFFFWHQSSLRSIAEKENLFDDKLTGDISVPQDNILKDSTAGISANNKASYKQSTGKIDYTIVPPPVAPASSNNAVATEKNSSSPSLSNQTARLSDTDTLNHSDTIPPRDNESTTNAASPLLQLCDSSSSTIKDFYSHLDNQGYMQQFNLPSGSEKYFTSLIQRLLDNPPIVSGETDDLFNILQNTAHFFRIIGKENILLLKVILDREKGQFENVLADFYNILLIPGCPEKSFSLNLNKTALYDYAGFFLNTMGGRLYLFRRDSMSRMVVSYYAILLIDHANKNSSNKHGIEITTAIDQLIQEIESTSNILLLREQYLDRLYDLKEEYQ